MKPRAGTEPRVARVRRLRRAAIAALALALLALAAAFALGYPILRRLDHRASKSGLDLSRALRKAHGLALYAPLDERAPEDVVTRLPLLGTAAVRVPGVVGQARRFDGRPGENLVSTHRWGPFARTGLTLSLWMRLPEGATNRESRLVWDHDASGTFGLRVRDGLLEAAFSDAEGLRSLAAPAPAPDRFAHAAFVLAPGRAALFVDGARVAEAKVAGPPALPAHGAAIGTDGHFPSAFDVDEWCVFNRPLDDAEVSRVASSRRAVADLLEPRLAARAPPCGAGGRVPLLPRRARLPPAGPRIARRLQPLDPDARAAALARRPPPLPQGPSRGRRLRIPDEGGRARPPRPGLVPRPHGGRPRVARRRRLRPAALRAPRLRPRRGGRTLRRRRLRPRAALPARAIRRAPPGRRHAPPARPDAPRAAAPRRRLPRTLLPRAVRDARAAVVRDGPARHRPSRPAPLLRARGRRHGRRRPFAGGEEGRLAPLRLAVRLGSAVSPPPGRGPPPRAPPRQEPRILPLPRSGARPRDGPRRQPRRVLRHERPRPRRRRPGPRVAEL